MATMKYIEDRIVGKQKELEKLENKLLRVEKAAASGWEVLSSKLDAPVPCSLFYPELVT